MKRYVAFFLSILLLTTMTACGAVSRPSIETEPPVEDTSSPRTTKEQDAGQQDTQEPEQDTQSTQSAQNTQGTEQTTDPDLAYSELIERFRALVADPFGQDSDEPGEMGVLEASRGAGDRAEYEMGYLVEDLSGDGIPELAVGQLSGPINALYTLVDGQPELIFEGWYRNSYVYMGDGHFYYYGSGSAAESGQGVFYLTKDGTALECESFLFTGLDSSGDILVYYNETGSWDPAESEESYMTAEEFWALDPAGEALPLAPFSGIDSFSTVESESPVSVRYLTEVGDEDYNWITLYDGPDACCILITPDSRVSDLSILNLFVEDVADDGTMTLSATLAGDDCHLDIVTKDTPIAVQLIFPGDLPAYGISCVDQYGVLRRFAIEISGDDGSLLLQEADPNESNFVLEGNE